jgi:multiple sugar transport system ATP-binding protein
LRGLRLPDRREGLRPGEEVVLGIRPEAFQDAALAGENGYALDARITLAEPLGPELIAHVRLDGSEQTLTARLDPRSRARAGEQPRVAVDLERLHFFDPETERAIR